MFSTNRSLLFLIVCVAFVSVVLCANNTAMSLKASVTEGFYISQQKDLKKLIRDALKSATERIDVAMYKFEDTDIAADLQAIAKNIKLTFIMDQIENDNKGSLVNAIEKAEPDNVSVKFLDNKLHAKFAIVDRKLLVAGSCNWSKGFDENDENLIVTRDPTLVANALEAIALLADS